MDKFVLVNDVSIKYDERNPEQEETIFFIHGNSSAARTWKKQLDSTRLKDFRLIAFDLPGHGSSDNLDEEDYNVIKIADLLSNAIKKISRNGNYILAGFCMGGCLAYETLAYGLKPKGMILISPNIIGGDISLQDNSQPYAEIDPLFKHHATDEEINSCYKKMYDLIDKEDYDFAIEDYKKTRPEFRTGLFKSAINVNYSNGPLLLQKSNIPLLIIFGQQDRVVNPDYIKKVSLKIWKEKIYIIDEGCHFVYIQQHEKVNNLILEYADEVFKQSN